MTVARLTVVQADITTLDVDAIVNAANESLLPGGGVCGAIHRAAGPELAAACAAQAPCPTGQTRVTPGFHLRAAHVIHAVGPVWQGGHQGEADLLASCYRESLRCAEGLGCRALAFPALSTGIYGYPPEAAAQLAVQTCRTWLRDHALPATVTLVAFDAGSLALLTRALEKEA